MISGKEFWLGLNKVFELTQSGNYTLRIWLTDADDITVEEVYETFAITENVSHRKIESKNHWVSRKSC